MNFKCDNLKTDFVVTKKKHFVYVYIERENEREIMYIHTHTHTHTYIYIWRERCIFFRKKPCFILTQLPFFNHLGRCGPIYRASFTRPGFCCHIRSKSWTKKHCSWRFVMLESFILFHIYDNGFFKRVC